MPNEIYLENLKKIVLSFFKDYSARIFFFGSRARGQFNFGSDVDIAVLTKNKADAKLIPELREILEKSNVPYKVDVIDFNEASESLRVQILKEGILWKDYN